MYTRNLRILNPDITDKQLMNTKCKFRKQFSKQIILGIIKKDHYEIIKRKAWLKCIFSVIQKLQDGLTGTYGDLYSIFWSRPRQKEFISQTLETQRFFMKQSIFRSQNQDSFIYDNLISNLQPIVAFQMPNLRKLDLRRNLIMCIQCLKRCQFPRLQQINLSDNIIRNCNDISDCYFPDLKRIIIEEKTYANIYMIYQQGRGQRQLKSNSRVNGYDLRWILKLQTKHLDYIKYAADARIIRKELQEQIGAKYYKVRVEKKNMQKGSLLPLMSF